MFFKMYIIPSMFLPHAMEARALITLSTAHPHISMVWGWIGAERNSPRMKTEETKPLKGICKWKTAVNKANFFHEENKLLWSALHSGKWNNSRQEMPFANNKQATWPKLMPSFEFFWDIRLRFIRETSLFLFYFLLHLLQSISKFLVVKRLSKCLKFAKSSFPVLE